MTKLLLRVFVKDYQNTQNPRVRRGYGMLASVVGICCNAVLCAAKIAVGIVFSSIAILADGLNNLSDAGSSFVSLFGFKLAGRPADAEHPFGHARYEYITGLVISFIILFLGLELAISSVRKIAAPDAITTGWIAVGVLGFSILLKLWMSFFNRSLAKRIGSITLKATAADSLNDVAATAAVLVSTLVAMYTPLNLDGYMGLLVALFIMWSGVKIMRETVSPLLGEVPEKEVVDGIVRQILEYPGVLGVHDLIVHTYGPSHFFASVHVEVDARVDILESHELTDTIGRDFESRGINLVVHMDPIVLDDPATNEFRKLVYDTVAELNEDYRVHDFRAVIGKNRNNLIFDVVVPPECKKSDDAVKSEIQDAVHAKNPTCFTVIEVDHNYIGPSGQ